MSEVRVENKVQEVMKKKGRTEEWVRSKFKELTGVTITEEVFRNIRLNKRQITLHEAVYIAKALDIKEYPDLLVQKKDVN